MKRCWLLLAVFVLLVPFPASAQEAEVFDEATYEQVLDGYDLSVFDDTLDDSVQEMLSSLGLDTFSYEALTALQPEDVLQLIKDIVADKIHTPLQSLAAILLFIVLSSLFRSFGTESESMRELFSTVSALLMAAVLVIAISPAVSLAAAAVGLAADFIYAFLPVFLTIVMASGGITTAFATNSMLLMLSQGLSALSSHFFMPLINCFLAIGICASLKSDLKLGGVVAMLKRLITGILSGIAGLYVTVLSLKTAVASRADVLGIRSLRLVINSVIPVVGSAISEGLLSIESYSSLIKSSVGIVGIVAVILVFLPSVLEVVAWRLALRLAGVLCAVFEDSSVAELLHTFSDVMLLLNVVLVLSAMTTVISLGILIAAGG